jgi:hypothetical protein
MGLAFVTADSSFAPLSVVVVDRSPAESGEIDPASTIESAAIGSDMEVAPGVGFFFMVCCSLGRRGSLGRHGIDPRADFT